MTEVMNELKYRTKINSIPAIKRLSNSFQAKNKQLLCACTGRAGGRQCFPQAN